MAGDWKEVASVIGGWERFFAVVLCKEKRVGILEVKGCDEEVEGD